MLFAIPWSIGGLLDSNGREKFDKFYRELVLGNNEAHPLPPNIDKINYFFPEEHSCYTYFFEVNR